MQAGKVRIFFNEPNKLYGFIQGDKKDVFFHLHRGGKFICDGSEDPVYVPAEPGELISPKIGDEVFYQLGESDKGPRATAWAYASSFLEADKLVEERPRFRLCRRSGFISDGAIFKIIWEGRNLADLRERYSKSNPIYRIHNEPQSALVIQTLEGDEWIYCKDPR